MWEESTRLRTEAWERQIKPCLVNYVVRLHVPLWYLHLTFAPLFPQSLHAQTFICQTSWRACECKCVCDTHLIPSLRWAVSLSWWCDSWVAGSGRRAWWQWKICLSHSPSLSLTLFLFGTSPANSAPPAAPNISLFVLFSPLNSAYNVCVLSCPKQSLIIYAFFQFAFSFKKKRLIHINYLCSVRLIRAKRHNMLKFKNSMSCCGHLKLRKKKSATPFRCLTPSGGYNKPFASQHHNIWMFSRPFLC